MRKMLMLVEREEISRGLAESLEYTEIGLRLGRDASVISREVARHGGRDRYRAAAAHTAAGAGRERPKQLAVERSPRLRAVVCQQLRDGWLWVPRTWSPHATCRYSCRRPPSRSCRSTRTAAPERGGMPLAGGC